MNVTRLKKIALFMFKCSRKLHANYLNAIAIPKISGQGTRNSHTSNLELERFKTITYGKNSLRFSGLKLFNSIPNTFKNEKVKIETLCAFLKEWTCNEGNNCDKCLDNVWHSS